MITIARADDLTVVLDILDEAADWLQGRGIRQWPARFSGGPDWRSARLERYVDAGQTWLLQVDDAPAAVFTLAGPDPHFAGGWPDDPEDALYLYRMAIRRRHAGQRLGEHIANWASARAAALEKAWLRLDCHRENPDLQAYYERQGFSRVGTIVVDIDPGAETTGQTYRRGSGALYQRPAGAIHVPPTPDRYDPSGAAAIWQAAAELVTAGKTEHQPPVISPWNTALEQAAHTLENQARGIRQGNGMYHRVISGQ